MSVYVRVCAYVSMYVYWDMYVHVSVRVSSCLVAVHVGLYVCIYTHRHVRASVYPTICV